MRSLERFRLNPSALDFSDNRGQKDQAHDLVFDFYSSSSSSSLSRLAKAKKVIPETAVTAATVASAVTIVELPSELAVTPAALA